MILNVFKIFLEHMISHINVITEMLIRMRCHFQNGIIWWFQFKKIMTFVTCHMKYFVCNALWSGVRPFPKCCHVISFKSIICSRSKVHVLKIVRLVTCHMWYGMDYGVHYRCIVVSFYIDNCESKHILNTDHPKYW